jgi:hypothetical protein
MSEVVALAFTEDCALSWDAFLGHFQELGFTLTDENVGIFTSKRGETFKATVFEEARYMLFEEVKKEGEEDSLLPNEVFDYIMSIEDDNALVSMGVDSGWGVDVDSEMNLKDFRKQFIAAQVEEE